MSKQIYLDYAATTPVDPRVAERMAECLTVDGLFANPASATHAMGRAARKAVEDAREQIAALINAAPQEIIFTSGATESDNLAIKGAACCHCRKGKHIITARTEHKAVLDTCKQLEKQGYEITWLVPDESGIVSPAQVVQALRDDTILVTLMHVNNEIGVIQDVAAIAEITRAKDVLFHVDAAQSAGKVPLDVTTMPIDLISFSAHKIYGPKGVGALYVRKEPRARIDCQMHGGGHEGGLRSGTLATHQIVGMGEAFRIAREELESDHQRILGLRNKLWDGIKDLPGVIANGDLRQRVAGILNVSFTQAEGESLLLVLKKLAVSSGSACTSASAEASYVLRALGRDDQAAQSAIRFSMGRFTTEAEIEAAIEVVRKGYSKLAELATA